MTDHKFRIGQLVRLQRGDATSASALYQVVNILPETPDGEHQYRLRGLYEPHERMVTERHMSRAVQIKAGLSGAGLA